MVADVYDGICRIAPQAELHDQATAGDPPPEKPSLFAAWKHFDGECTGFESSSLPSLGS
jgi:hypothetical protein